MNTKDRYEHTLHQLHNRMHSTLIAHMAKDNELAARSRREAHEMLDIALDAGCAYVGRLNVNQDGD